MACNSCSKPFTLFRKERGCPGCGFSFCSKCLDNKVLLKKNNSEAKVCLKCKNQPRDNDVKKFTEPPDAFFRKFGVMNTCDSNSETSNKVSNDTDEEIKRRLQNLKENTNNDSKTSTNEEIIERLQKIKGPQPTTSDAELHQRLANLRGVPSIALQNKAIVFMPDTRTEQKQVDDLMNQYLEQAILDKQYQEGFNRELQSIEERMIKLKGASTTHTDSVSSTTHGDDESDDEQTMLNKIIEKAKAESLMQYDDDIPSATNDELPFCEICNEDANLRCLGCRYLFCKRCFMEHKDDDDGCNRYEPYNPPKINNP